MFPGGQQLQNAAAHRISENVERVHWPISALVHAGIEGGGALGRRTRGHFVGSGRDRRAAPILAAATDEILAVLGCQPGCGLRPVDRGAGLDVAAVPILLRARVRAANLDDGGATIIRC
jgi:hypothetical protein